MAKLILTEKEKALPFWTDLDDASLGRAMKKMSLNWFSGLKDDNCKEGCYQLIVKCALIGVSLHLHDMNADTAEFTVDGISLGNVDLGGWKVTYERIREPSQRPQCAPDLNEGSPQ